MPKHDKRDSSSSDDSDSGPDDKPSGPPPSKKAKPSGLAKTNGSGETFFELEGTKRLTVRNFKGKIFVDIREFYEKDGEMCPGKKGICLSTSMWTKVKSLMDSVDSAVDAAR